MHSWNLRARAVALGLLAALLAPRASRADGAFPDSFGLFAPPGGRLVLSTTFGLIVSDPDGARWGWICEAVTGTNAFLYQAGPSGTLYASSPEGLKWSAPDACGWTPAGGTLAGASVVDVFPDPTDALRVLALARPRNPDQSFGPPGLYASADGGKTFGPALFVAPASTGLTGVEVARSDPRTVYLTMVEGSASFHPYIVRSRDGGASWDSPLDAQPALGSRYIRLAGVDPADANRLYLRVTDLNAPDNPDTLAISDDGGASFRFPTAADGGPLRLQYQMTAFLRRADGSLLIGVANPEATDTLFVSTDAGHTFRPIPGAPHVRALAERDGMLFVAADNYNDHAAIARSSDGGNTWQPVVRFDQLCGPLPCGDIPAACAADWETARLTVGIPDNTCGDAPDAGHAPPPVKQGCHCDAAGGAELACGGVLLLALRRRRRREGARRAAPSQTRGATDPE